MMMMMIIIIIIMPMSQLVKPSSFFQSSCVRLNPYGRRHHCGKELSSRIHGKSILLLGHPGAFYTRIEDA